MILAAIQPQMASVSAAVSSLGSRLDDQAAQMDVIKTSITTAPAAGPSQPELPPASDLPKFDPSNPWRSARYAPLVNGMLTVEGVGTRPVEDFETFPPNATFPFCYVRLHSDATVREDKVPKETVIYPRDRAQTCFMAETKGCVVNTKLQPDAGSLTMFLTSDTTPNPFSTKVFEAVLKQVKEKDSKGSALKEEERTSLLFPNDSDIWKDVHRTFTVGKLASDCASAQFHEDLPKLSEALITKEYEARTRLSRNLHTFTLLEFSLFKHPELEFLKVIAKSMVATIRHDLADFVLARRACRKHIFVHATIRHEPTKLIDGSVWGETLFPTALVLETIQEAAKACQNLRQRWGLSFKRKYQEGSGPQPKSTQKKKSKTPSKFRIPKLPQQQVVVPMSATGQPIQLPPGVQCVMTPQQSPAYNPSFQDRGQYRARGFNSQSRGRRGGGNQARGRGQNRGRGGQNKNSGTGQPSNQS